ncbi:MAG: hypothetical protein JNM09_19160 [Blastocatellia bacterium]|nr:hypothetical protein [Blastocatellia bacterium]
MGMSYEQIRAQVQQQFAQLPPEDRKRLLNDLLKKEQPAVRVWQGDARDYSRERQWLRENAQQFRGQTLALCGDELLAAGADPQSVCEQAKATGKRFLIHRVPAEGETWGGGLW